MPERIEEASRPLSSKFFDFVCRLHRAQPRVPVKERERERERERIWKRVVGGRERQFAAVVQGSCNLTRYGLDRRGTSLPGMCFL